MRLDMLIGLTQQLLRKQISWKLVSRISVQSQQTYHKVVMSLQQAMRKPIISIMKKLVLLTDNRDYPMIEDKTSDLLAEKTEALVNAVNCVGIMGRGIASQIKRIFTDNFDEVIRKTYSWSGRKQQFSERQLKIATDRLLQQGWIEGLAIPNSA